MYRSLSDPSRSSQCEIWEPNIVWETSSSSSECDFESPTRSRRLICYPVEEKNESEEVEKVKNQKGLKENFDLRNKVSSKTDTEALIKKIHDAAKLHLQNNVDTYVKLRNDEKTRWKSARIRKDEPLWSPRTALEKEAASHTPSKRVKFFASAQQFGLSQSLTPRSTYQSVTTPRRHKSPKTSTPKHRDGHLRVVPPNLSPVSAGPLTRRRKWLEEQKKSFFEGTDEPPSTDVPNETILDSASQETVQERPKAKEVPPTEIFIIPDDSWDLTDDSF